ncbi:UDP-glucose/GDP-mannose dehydrogenase family protein [Bacillus sp. NTK071]|uniref:UDP-glucose dehydrogenase family protein n=1 Tax=Bacillus sp. NTK071 TaxID=2802175 RepID=UPI001A8D56B5|nr:UDP-glucose/GDP-mannose dehydrogenase family protein [Bacillus sp. NTK071]MBN8210744.1 UDP-glucose/GDP-mannose dehydrogenase family protein [Bacillus sp. NTK071]
MRISVIGTGYVGLVTGVSLAEIGHQVTCIDIDEEKVALMSSGVSPIYEPELEHLMKKNIQAGHLSFTTQFNFSSTDVIYIAVGTPQLPDGTSDLQYIEQASHDIARSLTKDTIVVTKSTVPVGTNHWIKTLIEEAAPKKIKVTIASNPEFLREGSAVYDTFNGDRIVIGTENNEAKEILEEINAPFGLPIYHTDLKSAEMIKYASNAFLATKISFINEISAICEKVGANVEDVAFGMGKDNRIGDKFLNAGIGYGGSCFPKDTNALVQIAGNNEHDFRLLKSVIEVNNSQRMKLVQRAREAIGDLCGKRIALLGLAFKPNTDDMREAASIPIAQELVKQGAEVIAFDPIAIPNARTFLPVEVQYKDTIDETIRGADVALIVTEWDVIKSIDLMTYTTLMTSPIVIDGRNCYSLEEVAKYPIHYISIGRPPIKNGFVTPTAKTRERSR